MGPLGPMCPMGTVGPMELDPLSKVRFLIMGTYFRLALDLIVYNSVEIVSK